MNAQTEDQLNNDVINLLRNLKRMPRASESKRSLIVTFGVMLLHGIACRYTADGIRAQLEYFSWELFDHPRFSPHFASSDYDLFTWLGSQNFSNDEILIEGLRTWLSSEAVELSYSGLQKRTSLRRGRQNLVV
jgi:hypothetical protein